MDLGVYYLERSSTNHVEYSIMVHAHSSNYEGVGVMELAWVLMGCLIVVTWLVVGGEGDE